MKSRGRSDSVVRHDLIFERQNRAGLLLKGDDIIYHTGIIDWLVRYTPKKKLETMSHTLRFHGNTASCVHPTDYADRQITFAKEAITRSMGDYVNGDNDKDEEKVPSFVWRELENRGLVQNIDDEPAADR